MKEEQTILSHDPQQNFNIYKGYFGMIQRGDIIPVGGSIFSRYASEFLEIDETVEGSKIDRVKLERAYISQKDNLESWMQQAGITLSSELYFRLWNTLSKVQSTLKTDLPTDIQERKRYYTQKSTLRISELIGNTACAERAALGAYILKEIGMEAYYMSGMSFRKDIDDGEAHSWIILPQGEKTIIFDIARPLRMQDGTYLPQIYEISGKFDAETLGTSDNFYVCAKSVYGNTSVHFGVGDGKFTSDIPNIVSGILGASE